MKVADRIMRAWRARVTRSDLLNHGRLGAVLFEGESRFDKKPIAVVATNFRTPSGNTKTADLIPTYIFRTDISPTAAIASGDDRSVCGTCAHRPGRLARRDGEGAGDEGDCYVNVFTAPTQVFKAYHEGRYYRLAGRGGVDEDAIREVFAGALVRFGSYGDPALAPYTVWRALASSARGHTGYTQCWRWLTARWRPLVMASVRSRADEERAQALGWRTFRQVRARDLGTERGPAPGALRCPADAEGGRSGNCAACLACSGSGDPRPSFWIQKHGFRIDAAERAERAGQTVIEF